MLHEDRFIVPILKRVGEREERREVYEGRKWFTRTERGKEGRRGGRKEEWFIRCGGGGVGKRSGFQGIERGEEEGERSGLWCSGDGWGRGAVYKGQRG